MATEMSSSPVASPAPSPRSQRRAAAEVRKPSKKQAAKAAALAASHLRPVDVPIKAKGAAMRPADDVVKRLRSDPSVPVADMIVGYEDRFLGIIEKAFLDLNWAEFSSLSHVSVAIPKHRIVYFKYRTLIVWDRRTKLDNVFGSLGGSRLPDVIAAHQAAIAAAPDANADEEHDNADETQDVAAAAVAAHDDGEEVEEEEDEWEDDNDDVDDGFAGEL
eukprot:m.235348 g.235348  ORF g.235348 m.235348 type:complete len:218 (+) comp20021_c0_seq1:92-745(+)